MHESPEQQTDARIQEEQARNQLRILEAQNLLEQRHVETSCTVHPGPGGCDGNHHEHLDIGHEHLVDHSQESIVDSRLTHDNHSEASSKEAHIHTIDCGHEQKIPLQDAPKVICQHDNCSGHHADDEHSHHLDHNHDEDHHLVDAHKALQAERTNEKIKRSREANDTQHARIIVEDSLRQAVYRREEEIILEKKDQIGKSSTSKATVSTSYQAKKVFKKANAPIDANSRTEKSHSHTPKTATKALKEKNQKITTEVLGKKASLRRSDTTRKVGVDAAIERSKTTKHELDKLRVVTDATEANNQAIETTANSSFADAGEDAFVETDYTTNVSTIPTAHSEPHREDADARNFNDAVPIVAAEFDIANLEETAFSNAESASISDISETPTEETSVTAEVGLDSMQQEELHPLGGTEVGELPAAKKEAPEYISIVSELALTITESLTLDVTARNKTEGRQQLINAELEEYLSDNVSKLETLIATDNVDIETLQKLFMEIIKKLEIDLPEEKIVFYLNSYGLKFIGDVLEALKSVEAYNTGYKLSSTQKTDNNYTVASIGKMILLLITHTMSPVFSSKPV